MVARKQDFTFDKSTMGDFGGILPRELAHRTLVEREILFASHHGQRPGSFECNAEAGNTRGEKDRISKAGVAQLLPQSFLREQPHLQRSSNTAVEDEVIPDLELPIVRPVDQDERAIQVHDGVVMQVREMLHRVLLERERNAQAEYAVRLEQP